MGTHAIISFRDSETSNTADSPAEFHIFKHWDGDPETIADCLRKALSLAWPLPRFEADEFAAAFVAANKDGAGDIRIAPSRDGMGIDFWYGVYPSSTGVLMVDCRDGNGKILWGGVFTEFAAAAKILGE